MSASEFWSKAERCMSENQFDDDLAQTLVDEGYVLPEHHDVVNRELSKHSNVYPEDEYNSHCECGKWLEIGYYEWPDHVGDVLDEWITKPGKETP